MEQTNQESSTKGTQERKEPAVSVYNFSEVDLPQATEKSYEDFVTYGEDNLFPQDLIHAWLQSSTHNALTTGIIQMIAGEGVEVEGEGENLEFATLKKRINRKGETLDDLINKTAFDLYLHGYFGWQIVWNQARTQIVEIYHTPGEQIRSGKADDLGVINEYYTSWDWSQYRKDKFKPQRVKAFDPSDRSEGRQMIFVKQYRPNQYYYSTPSYIGGMAWILLDNRVGEFHLNNIDNGFFPSSVVQFFNGEPPQEEKRKIEQGFLQKFTGKQQSKIVFVYNDNQDTKVAFDTYEPANIDKRFKELMPEISKNIMIAHRVPSPLIFGVREGGGLGNNAEELESSSLLMNKMVVLPLQKIILQTLTKIFKINQWDLEVTINTLQPAQWLEGKDDDAEATEEMRKFSKGNQIVPEKAIKSIIQHLKENGESREELEKNGWVLIHDGEGYTAEGAALKLKGEDFTISSKPEDDSYLDKGMFKTRYEYRGPKDDKNRDFCADVLNLSLVYRREDIDTMTTNVENPEFGRYSIWDYKGSYGCRHRWHRLVFIRRRKSN